MRLLLLLATIMSLGCGAFTDPVVGVESTIEYRGGSGTTAPFGATLPPTVQRVGDQLEVLGLFNLPTPCYELRVRSTQAGGLVIVSVEATRNEGACITVLAGFAYRVRSTLPDDVSRVVVQHSFVGISNSTVVVRDTSLLQR